MQRLLALAAVLAALAASTHALASSARTFAIRGDVTIGAYAVRADGSFSGAITAFGQPTSARHTYGRESCRASWPNHGLTIDFYNLGGADACDPDAGRFSRAYMRGNHWLTTKHLKIGDPVTKLRALYPTAHLAAIARVTCRELTRQERVSFQEMCAVMQGLKPISPEVDRAFQNGEGMTFAQFKADIERVRIEYVFRQLVGKVPIEHSGLVADRWEGETVTQVTGTIFVKFAIVNKVALMVPKAGVVALRQLRQLRGVRSVQERPPTRGDLVLLPYGGKGTGRTAVPALRYAYRVLLFGTVQGSPPNFQASWLGWMDARTGKLLKLIPQFNFVGGVAPQWRRAADVAVQTGFVEVNPSSGGQYTLQLPGFMNRVDRLGNGTFADGEVSISDSSGGSSSTFANFNQAPINDGANAVCQAGGNTTFRQANDYFNLYLMRTLIVNSGTIPTFPENAITTRMDMPGIGNSAGYDALGTGLSVLNFAIGDGAGGGWSDPACPNGLNTKQNGSTDSTTLIHELAHLSTKRIQERRPTNWCGMVACAMPIGYSTVHDLADAMAHHYASINCMGGWSRHSEGGLNASLNCAANSDEDGGLPRLSQVTSRSIRPLRATTSRSTACSGQGTTRTCRSSVRPCGQSDRGCGASACPRGRPSSSSG